MTEMPELDWGKNFIHKLDLSHGSLILDVGCQQGQLSVYMARCYPKKHFIAIDPCINAIERARYHDVSNVTFQAVEVTSLETAEQFDAVVSLHYLHRIPEIYPTLQAIHRVLKADGKVYFQLALRDQPEPFFCSTVPFPLHALPQKPALRDITILLDRIGFSIEWMEYVHYEAVFTTREALRCWLVHWLYWRVQLAQHKEALIDHIVYTCEQANHSAWCYRNVVLELICNKERIAFSLSISLRSALLYQARSTGTEALLTRQDGQRNRTFIIGHEQDH